MIAPVLVAREVAAGYGLREIFTDVSFELLPGQSLGVLGASGAGKTTLLRILVRLLRPWAGEVTVRGAVAYFAGDATLPGSVRAAAWASLGSADLLIPERRRLRTLSRGTRQLLGLRTVLSRHPLDLIVLDEPWEGLDPDASRWLTSTLHAKRDRGAALVLSSHRVQDLAGLCDAYLFMLPKRVELLKAHQIAAVGPVTAALLTGLYDRLRDGAALRAVS